MAQVAAPLPPLLEKMPQPTQPAWPSEWEQQQALLSRKRKCGGGVTGGSPHDFLDAAASALLHGSLGDLCSADSAVAESSFVDLAAATDDSPDSICRRCSAPAPITPGAPGPKRQRLLPAQPSETSTATAALSVPLATASNSGGTPPAQGSAKAAAAAVVIEPSPPSADLLRLPAMPPPLGAVLRRNGSSLLDGGCSAGSWSGSLAAGSLDVDLGGNAAAAGFSGSFSATANAAFAAVRAASTCDQTPPPAPITVNNCHAPELSQAPHSGGSNGGFSAADTWAALHRQPTVLVQSQRQLAEAQRQVTGLQQSALAFPAQHGGSADVAGLTFDWTYALGAVPMAQRASRLRRSVSDSRPPNSSGVQQQLHTPFSQLLADAERRAGIGSFAAAPALAQQAQSQPFVPSLQQHTLQQHHHQQQQQQQQQAVADAPRPGLRSCTSLPPVLRRGIPLSAAAWRSRVAAPASTATLSLPAAAAYVQQQPQQLSAFSLAAQQPPQHPQRQQQQDQPNYSSLQQGAASFSLRLQASADEALERKAAAVHQALQQQLQQLESRQQQHAMEQQLAQQQAQKQQQLAVQQLAAQQQAAQQQLQRQRQQQALLFRSQSAHAALQPPLAHLHHHQQQQQQWAPSQQISAKAASSFSYARSHAFSHGPAPAVVSAAAQSPACSPAVAVPAAGTGAPEFVAKWARLLPLRREETQLLALHMWERVCRHVSAADFATLGVRRPPQQAALLGCLWIAAKLEERRRGLPPASKIGELLGMNKKVVAAVELHVMGLLDWAPTRGWQSRRLTFKA